MSLSGLRLASEATVRAILVALCDNKDVREKALRYLAQLEPQTAQIAKDVSEPVKRKPKSGLAICVQCESAFEEADNNVKQCQYHSGYMEPDYESDFWADHDEDCHGVIDSDFCRKEYPEGFIWSCCDRNGEEKGCKFSRHVSDPARSKRGRGDASSLSSWAEEPGAPGNPEDQDDNDEEDEEDEEE